MVTELSGFDFTVVPVTRLLTDMVVVTIGARIWVSHVGVLLLHAIKRTMAVKSKRKIYLVFFIQGGG